tara:strand:+ start:1752 stop:1946 length:195 start_codon:yes stop_codon:yes gene_type:complete
VCGLPLTEDGDAAHLAAAAKPPPPPAKEKKKKKKRLQQKIDAYWVECAESGGFSTQTPRPCTVS